jgi:spore photoproduct lyase
MRRPETIYVEKRAQHYPGTERILSLFPAARQILIDHHSALFHRKRQSFRLQKEHPALIVALSEGPYLYTAPSRVDSGTIRSLYTDQLRNCLFDCDYCFLQGMHASAYPVIHVNNDDYHSAAIMLASDDHIRINTSFLTDALSFEHIIPTVSGWMGVAEHNSRIHIEIRTKSAVNTPFLNRPPLSNVTGVWTLSPRKLADRYERGCATIDERFAALEALVESGWRPGVALDPIILVPGWQKLYAELVDEMAARLSPDRTGGISYGVFRMATAFLETTRSSRADSPILYHPYERKDGLATYTDAELEQVQSVIGTRLVDRYGSDQVTFVHG